MIHEVRIELAESHCRTLSIVARDSSTPKQIIDNHNPSLTQTRQTEIEIPRIFLFNRIDEKQIESLIELRHHLQRLTSFDLNLIEQPRTPKITSRRTDHLVTRI